MKKYKRVCQLNPGDHIPKYGYIREIDDIGRYFIVIFENNKKTWFNPCSVIGVSQ